MKELIEMESRLRNIPLITEKLISELQKLFLKCVGFQSVASLF